MKYSHDNGVENNVSLFIGVVVFLVIGLVLAGFLFVKWVESRFMPLTPVQTSSVRQTGALKVESGASRFYEDGTVDLQPSKGVTMQGSQRELR